MGKTKLMTKNFLAITSVSFCCSLNYFALLISITGFATSSFGVSTGEAGVSAGLYVIGGLSSRLLLGKYIELVGRKKMLLISLSGSLIMSMMYFGVNSLLMLCLVRFFHGMTYGLSHSTSADIAAKLVPPERRGEGLGYYALNVTFATAIGPFIGLTLTRNEDYFMIFTVCALMYLVALIIALFVQVNEEKLTEEQKIEAKSFNLTNIIQISALPMSFSIMIFLFSYSGVLSFINLYTIEINLVEVATYYYIAVSVGTLLSRLIVGRIYDTRGANYVMIPAYALFFIGMIVFATASEPYSLLIAGFTIGIGVSTVFSTGQAVVISKSPPHRYGVTTSTFAAFADAGTGIGPMILGTLISFIGYRDMYMACAIFSLFGFVMYLYAYNSKRFSKSIESA